jgi:hypothetical protein
MRGIGRTFFICLPSNQIPDWFTYQGEGASMHFKVHTDDDQILKGFAVCVVYSIQVLVLSPYRGITSFINYTKNTIFTVPAETSGGTFHRGDHMWVGNVLTNNFEDGDEAEIVVDSGVETTVKRLGICLGYEGDVDGK